MNFGYKRAFDSLEILPELILQLLIRNLGLAVKFVK